MKRLITLLTIILTIVLVTPAAWAERSQAMMNQGASYKDRAPAVFFGYTDIDKIAVNSTETLGGVADEKGTEVLKCIFRMIPAIDSD